LRVIFIKLKFSIKIAVLSHISANYLSAGVISQRQGTAHGSIVPYQVINFLFLLKNDFSPKFRLLKLKMVDI
jgi:hypothetical protein